MAQVFRIATSSKMDAFFTVGKKSKVEEDLFWQTLETKVKELTNKKPERYDEVLENAKTHLKSGLSLTVKDTWFQISGRS